MRVLYLIIDPHNLGIRCRLNGELVQNSNTNQLVHKTESLIAFTSRYVKCNQFFMHFCFILVYLLIRFMTLKPGDLILTGTPPGVGCFRKPPVWLKASKLPFLSLRTEYQTIVNCVYYWNTFMVTVYSKCVL